MTSNLIPLNYRPQNSMGFIYQYLSEKLMNKQTIEIELRMGFFKTDFSKDKFKSKYTSVSKQGHLVVNHNIKNKYSFLQTSIKEFQQYKLQFNPNLNLLQFSRISQQLDKLVKKQDQKNEILVDFITKNKKRFTWNVIKNSIYENSKKNKENIDLLHQGFEYRLSTSEENCIQIQDIEEMFKQNSIQFARVKLRVHYYFQFLDYCLTKTLSIKDSTILRNLIKLAKNVQEKVVDEEELFSVVNCSKVQYANEIEVEICDNQFLRNFIKTNNFIAFNSCIDKFFRNFELLYFIDDDYVSQNFVKFCQNEKIPIRYPIIGSYLEKIIDQLNYFVYKIYILIFLDFSKFNQFFIMNKTEYDQKREELVDQHPTVMKENWLRNSRIIIAVLFLVVVKLSQANLPIYNISCVQDNILPYFLPLQNHLGENSQKLIEIFFLFSFLMVFIGTLTHWMMQSQRAQLAIMICIFFLVKTLSDVSLVLDKPEGAIWQQFSIGFALKPEYLFYANVDPFTGLLLIFFYYYACEEKSKYKALILTSLGIYFVLFLIFILTFQLFFTFAIFSSILTFIFAIFVSQKIENNYFKYKKDDLTDQMVKETED